MEVQEGRKGRWQLMASNRFSICANDSGYATFSFPLNPIGHTLRQGFKQNLVQLIDGSVFIIEPNKDSTVLTLEWRGVPEDTYGSFIFGNAENMRFNECYFYYASDIDNVEEPIVTNCTYESYTTDTVNIPFIDRGNNIEEVSIDERDRIFVGLDEQFTGILFDFEDFHSNQNDSAGNNYVDSIRLRFSVESGDIDSGDSIIYDGTNYVEDDSTELFTNYGELRWSLSQVPNWGKCTMQDILTNTTGTDTFYLPTGFTSTEELYFVEIKITPDSTYTYLINPKLQSIKVALDSLEAMAARKSNGILPIWYINIPDIFKYHRPRGYRDSDWIGVKATNFEATLSNPTDIRWDVVLSLVPIVAGERREIFTLDVSELDGSAYLGI